MPGSPASAACSTSLCLPSKEGERGEVLQAVGAGLVPAALFHFRSE